MSLNIRFRALKSSGATKSYARTLLTQPIILKRTIHSSLSAVSRSCDLSLLFTSSLLLSQFSDICPIYEHDLNTPRFECAPSLLLIHEKGANFHWSLSIISEILPLITSLKREEVKHPIHIDFCDLPLPLLPHLLHQSSKCFSLFVFFSRRLW